MGVLQELAVDLDVQERTLRRAASQGTLRARPERTAATATCVG